MINFISVVVAALQGCKTYIALCALGILLFGSWQNWWKIPGEVYGLLAAAAGAFFRAGMAREMKRIGGAATAVVLLFSLTCMDLRGQEVTNAPPANTGSFFSSVTGYFSSFNTNLDSTFSGAKGSIWTGVDSIQGGGASMANQLGVSYKVYGLLSAESLTRNSGIAGTLLSEQIGVGVNFCVHDTRLTVFADAGMDLNGSKAQGRFSDKIFGEVGLRVCKALTTHTFGGVGIAGQFPRNAQVFSAFAGFTF